MTTDDIASRLAAIRERIADAAAAAGRTPDDVTLVAAAKRQPAEAMRAAVELGVEAIGHNYVRELRQARADVGPSAVRWHFIGTLQSSTAHHVADLADVVETLAGDRAVRRLAARAERAGRTVDGLLEVDFTGRRSGYAPDEVAAAVDRVAALDGVRLRGLMTIPPPTPTAEEARPWFRRLRELRDDVRERHPEVLDLSMGMSLDYQVAVHEGATMVRIGTALFGPRT
ncbi:MAG TPA: YggS family pyridoxal phosphate-dependent enzyme [Actinomycetota bacterium]|nr:YggS family pyridoxal phosphate-dependent enzyme [Actinomycetota bacterium]